VIAYSVKSKRRTMQHLIEFILLIFEIAISDMNFHTQFSTNLHFYIFEGYRQIKTHKAPHTI